jgi:beta-lactamase superfamily II metal-dependent hydrolase
LERLAERGVAVLRTDLQGTVEVFTDGQGLWVRTER